MNPPYLVQQAKQAKSKKKSANWLAKSILVL